jgi:hypothetical protein
MTTQEYIVGLIDGQLGYNTLQSISITPNNNTPVNITIIITDNYITNTITINKTINSETIIEQKETYPYPSMALLINNEKIHSKKYYYENVKIIVEGNYIAKTFNVSSYDR